MLADWQTDGQTDRKNILLVLQQEQFLVGVQTDTQADGGQTYQSEVKPVGDLLSWFMATCKKTSLGHYIWGFKSAATLMYW